MSTMLEVRRAVRVPAAITILLLSGCADSISQPSLARAAESQLRADVAPLGKATASVRWSAILRDFISAKEGAAKPSAVYAFRAFAYLSVAQYRAVVAAAAAPGGVPHVSPQGAVDAASSAVLSALFPAD